MSYNPSVPIQADIVDQIVDVVNKLASYTNGYKIINPSYNIVPTIKAFDINKNSKNEIYLTANKLGEAELPNAIEVTYNLGDTSPIGSITTVLTIEEDRNNVKSLTATVIQITGNYGKSVDIFLLYMMLIISHRLGITHVRIPVRYEKEPLITLKKLEAERSWGRYRLGFDRDQALLNLKKIDENALADGLSSVVTRLIKDDIGNKMAVMAMGGKANKTVWLQSVSTILPKIARMIPPPEPEKNVANKLKGFKNNLQNSTKRQRMLNNAKGQLNSGLSKAKNLGSQAWGSFSNRFLSKSTPAPAAAPAPQPAPAAAPAAAPAPAAPQPAAKKGFFGWGGARRSVKRRSSKAHRKSSKAHHKRRKSSKRH